MVLATMTETENSGEIDAVLSVLESATKSSNKFGAIATSAQSAYVNRLLSFNAVSYYAKPNCLSPIVCARLGYVAFLLRMDVAKKEQCTGDEEHNTRSLLSLGICTRPIHIVLTHSNAFQYQTV
jgi:hypothetical protein